MVPTTFLVAALLLTSAPGTLDLSDSALMHAAYAPAVKMLAIHWEILDPREVDMLTRAQDFPQDLKVLQGRFQELAKAPAMAESARFPCRTLVNDLLAFNRSFQKDLEARLALDHIHSADLQAALEESAQLFRIWDAVREARCEYYYVTVRRQALQQLRELIGMEAFYCGRLPPNVPLWRFPEY